MRVLSLLFIVSSLLFGGEKLEKITLKLQYDHNPQFAGYYVAKELGFYKKAGFDVDIQKGYLKDVLDGVSSGKYEFGISNGSVIQYYYKGKHPKSLVVMMPVFQRTPTILIARKSKIDSLKNLKGKNAYILDTSNPVLKMLEANNIKKTDFNNRFDKNKKTKKGLWNRGIDLFLEGKVDVAVGWNYSDWIADIEKKLGEELRIFIPATHGIKSYGDILIANKEYTKNNYEAALRFKQATIKGWKHVIKSHGFAEDLIYKKYNGTNLDKEGIKKSLQETIKHIGSDFIDVGFIDTKKVENLVKYEQKKYEKNSEENEEEYNNILHGSLKPSGDISGIVLGSALVILFVCLIYELIKNAKLRISLNKRKKELKKRYKKLDELNQIIDKQVYIMHFNLNGACTYTSSLMSRFIAKDAHSILGMSFEDIFKGNDDAIKKTKEALEMTKQGKNSNAKNISLRNHKGDIKYFDVNHSPVKIKQKIASMAIIAKDISTQKKVEELLITDSLTNVYNRLMLNERLEYKMSMYKRYGIEFCVIMIDIDDFKACNDNYGHQFGDEVLIKVSQTIQNTVRKTDVFGRWGGEEFMIISPKTTQDAAYNVAEKARKAVEKLSLSNGSNISASFGVSSIEMVEPKTINEVIKKADEALYEAKRQGKNRVVKASS